jgi:sigma-E factor negative regulatory protein RseC
LIAYRTAIFFLMEQKMAKKKGRVIGISQDGWAKVITERGDACNNCEAAQFCHSIADCSKLETNVLNKAGAEVGDLVTVDLSSKMVFKGALILYIVPVAGLLSGAITGTGLSPKLAISETAASMAFGFAGLILGFVITAFISSRLMSKNQLIPAITQIIKRRASIYSA